MTTVNGQFCPIDNKMCFDGDCGHCQTYREAQRKPPSFRGHLKDGQSRTIHEANDLYIRRPTILSHIFDTQKKCPNCDWHAGYNARHDWRHRHLLKGCPVCQTDLETLPYSPEF